jgi:hypothetical protein
MGCACAQIQSLGTFQGNPDGIGVSPDGLGTYSGPPLFGSMSGNLLGDAVIGAAVSYFLAPPSADPKLWAGLGAAAGALAGTIGLVGMIGAAMWQRGKE